MMYRHFKGGLYRLLHHALYEPSGELVVVYQGEDGKVWVRPHSVFNQLMGDGRRRFEPVET
jgi:hypothetical protein